MGQRTVWKFLRKLKTELPYHPVIPCLGIYKAKIIIQKYTCTPKFIAALFTVAKTWYQPKCSSTENMHTHTHTHTTCNRILLSHKKDEIMPFTAT